MVETISEQTYVSDLKEWINQIILEDGLPFSQAKVEIIKERKKADLLLYDKDNNCSLIIEVKRPADSPSEPETVKQAFGYAQNYRDVGLKCFGTHNVNFLILWDPVTGKKVDQFKVTYVTQLEEYARKKDEIKESFRTILRWYVGFLQGEPPKPIDESIIEILNSFIQGIVSSTGLVGRQIESYIKDNAYRKRFEDWLMDKGWEGPKGDKKKLEEYSVTLAKQFLYIFTNKILFYNVLRQKYGKEVPSTELPKDLIASRFYDLLDMYFSFATVASGDFETVFQTNFVDRIPLPNDTVDELVKLTGYLSTLEYSNIGYDILGKVLEKLIPQDERHKLGQYFTRSDVVDLILGFCVKDADCRILDPACGSGTFLVRGYYRLKYLNGKKPHDELLKQIWGVDIDKFPAHLATINLAIRDLSAKENYPNVIYKDFFDITGPLSKIKIGVQHDLTKWMETEKRPIVEVRGLDTRVLEKEIPIMECVVGNPPYTRQEEMGGKIFGEEYKKKILDVIKSDFKEAILPLRSGIYAYFFPHGAKFLKDQARLGFVCLRSWLDTGYGAALQTFFLSNFKIIAVLESKDERWFPDAQMLPCIVILEICQEEKERRENLVKFVQLKVPLSEIVPTIMDERDLVQEIHRWKQCEAFVNLIETAQVSLKFKTMNFLGREAMLYEDARIRIVGIKQKHLERDNKWGKYLSAPSVYFKILERAKGKMVPLEEVAQVNLGIKTGANEFFCFPNKYFDVAREDNFYTLTDKATGSQYFRIEKEFLKPVAIKIKPHKEIGLGKSDGMILTVHDSLDELKRNKKQVSEYLLYGERKSIRLTRGREKGQTITGYQNIKSVKGRTPWYDLGVRNPPHLIFPSIFWARYLVFWNKIGAFPTNAFFEIHPKRADLANSICALLNSTLTALMVEFSGRYIENRDRTISNQIMVFEVQGLPIIDPSKIDERQLVSLESAIKQIMDRPIGLRALYDPREIAEKRKLDKIVFCDILGLSEDEMKQACEALAEIVKRRIERPLASTS